MKKILISLSLFIATFFVINNSYSQTSSFTRPVVGVLNTQIIERDSLAAKGVRLERDKFVTRYQTEIKAVETELREEEERLQQQRNVLAPEVFQQQVQAFQERFANAQQEIRIKQQNLQNVYDQSLNTIRQEMLRISGSVAQEKGINMVVPQNVVLLSDPSMDITIPVLELLNERLPSVDMQDPEVDVSNDQ